ncbi:hypothetical protein CDL12_16591 [Handroanthus impetiginosus]|uniref:Uncharacterized protein n=1 Tax=Handroanthus impetiginosus TaxID=429701 RepID=A0A2G9H0N0_9LAMI|nr:hypothetical protein CDL12_16591 [Handroanthus impetiginosus]
MCYPGDACRRVAYTWASLHLTSAGAAARGGGGTTTKVCVCSPTSHPGSFRCRQHHVEYQWVSRVGLNPRPPSHIISKSFTANVCLDHC